jgi:hypothetical protein
VQQESAAQVTAPTVVTQNAPAAPTQAPQPTTSVDVQQSVVIQQPPPSKPEQPATQTQSSQPVAPPQPAQASAPPAAAPPAPQPAPNVANASSASSAAPAPPAPSVPAPIDASALLLRPSDLGDGWTSLTLEGPTARPEIRCGSQPLTLGPGIQSEARSAFQAGATGPYLAQSLFVAGSVSEAQDAMWVLWQQATCSSLSIAGIPGGPYAYQIGHAPFPRFGAETLALTLTPDDSAALPADVVVVRQGRLLTMLVSLGVDGVDQNKTAAFTNVAVEKLATAAQ